MFYIKPRTFFTFDAAELTCLCHVLPDDTRTLESLSHSVTPSFIFSDEIVFKAGLFTQMHDFEFFRTMVS